MLGRRSFSEGGKRVIQYAETSRFNNACLWNTGSPGPVSAKASPGPQMRSAAEALAKAASWAMTGEGSFGGWGRLIRPASRALG